MDETAVYRITLGHEGKQRSFAIHLERDDDGWSGSLHYRRRLLVVTAPQSSREEAFSLVAASTLGYIGAELG